MRKVALAEWILALTVAPDRAATTVGDLVEDASTRGVLWFWSGVLWTALSHLWRDLSAAPFRLGMLALCGCVMEFLLTFVSAEGIIYIWGQIHLHILGCPAPCQYWPRLWVEKTIVYTLGGIIVPFLVGWMVGRLSRGKELAAAFTLTFVSVVIHFLYVWELTREQTNHPERIYGTQESSTATAWIPLLFVFVGTMCFRWLVGSRRLRATPST